MRSVSDDAPSDAQFGVRCLAPDGAISPRDRHRPVAEERPGKFKLLAGRGGLG